MSMNNSTPLFSRIDLADVAEVAVAYGYASCNSGCSLEDAREKIKNIILKMGKESKNAILHGTKNSG